MYSAQKMHPKFIAHSVAPPVHRPPVTQGLVTVATDQCVVMSQIIKLPAHCGTACAAMTVTCGLITVATDQSVINIWR